MTNVYCKFALVLIFLAPFTATAKSGETAAIEPSESKQEAQNAVQHWQDELTVYLGTNDDLELQKFAMSSFDEEQRGELISAVFASPSASYELKRDVLLYCGRDPLLSTCRERGYFEALVKERPDAFDGYLVALSSLDKQDKSGASELVQSMAMATDMQVFRWDSAKGLLVAVEEYMKLNPPPSAMFTDAWFEHEFPEELATQYVAPVTVMAYMVGQPIPPFNRLTRICKTTDEKYLQKNCLSIARHLQEQSPTYFGIGMGRAIERETRRNIDPNDPVIAELEMDRQLQQLLMQCEQPTWTTLQSGDPGPDEYRRFITEMIEFGERTANQNAALREWQADPDRSAENDPRLCGERVEALVMEGVD